MKTRETQISGLNLTELAQTIAEYEAASISWNRVDGLIIGTGKSDFTQGNVPYTLEYEGKTFELIDVPGIEGDESKFTRMVQEAVARAHLVFYVNGTNKKPEKTTADKIRNYLGRGSNVCPLVNVRGNADSYEFEEDRESLCRGAAEAALKQTEEVLESVLGKEVLLPGHCVQGLIAFSALAYDPVSGTTTIHASRESDLVRQQRNYLKCFDDVSAMRNFSQIEAVADVLKSKLSTYREDIINANRAKVLELLERNRDVLEKQLESYKVFLKKIGPEFEKCRESIKEAIVSFNRHVVNEKKDIYARIFNDLADESDGIIEEYFGDNDAIRYRIESAFERLAQDAQSELDKSIEENLEVLRFQLKESVNRLVEDAKRINLEMTFINKRLSGWSFSHHGNLGWNLDLKNFGSILFQVGSYAGSGLAIGTVFPGIGQIVGAVAGAVIGLTMSLVNVLVRKKTRIRKDQAKVRRKLNEEKNNKEQELIREVKELVSFVEKKVNEDVVAKINNLEKGLCVPVDVISKQIAGLDNLKFEISRVNYGPVEAV